MSLPIRTVNLPIRGDKSLARLRTVVTCSLTNAFNAPVYTGHLVGCYVRILRDGYLFYARTDRTLNLRTATLALDHAYAAWLGRINRPARISRIERQTAAETLLTRSPESAATYLSAMNLEMTPAEARLCASASSIPSITHDDTYISSRLQPLPSSVFVQPSIEEYRAFPRHLVIVGLLLLGFGIPARAETSANSASYASINSHHANVMHPANAKAVTITRYECEVQPPAITAVPVSLAKPNW